MSTVMAVCPSCRAKNRIPPEKQHLAPKCGRCGGSLAGVPLTGIVNTLTDSTFQQRVEQAALPVLVDFYSPACGPCRMLAPVIERIARMYMGRLVVCKIDTSTQPLNAGRFQVRGVPTLLFFRNGKMVDQTVGALSQSELEAWINRLFA